MKTEATCENVFYDLQPVLQGSSPSVSTFFPISEIYYFFIRFLNHISFLVLIFLRQCGQLLSLTMTTLAILSEIDISLEQHLFPSQLEMNHLLNGTTPEIQHSK